MSWDNRRTLIIPLCNLIRQLRLAEIPLPPWLVKVNRTSEILQRALTSLLGCWN
jgi:hypothetical protein